MCLYTPHIPSNLCILPPHILRAIAQNGTPQQRTAAMQTLASDATFRTLRAAARPLANVPSRPTARQHCDESDCKTK